MDRSTLTIELLKLFVELVKALAWPVAAIVLVLIFKDRLGKLIDKLKDFDGLGMKASFATEVKKVEAEVEQLKLEENLNIQDEAPTHAPVDGVAPPPVDEPPPALPNLDLDQPLTNYLLLYGNPTSGFQSGRQYLERALVDQFVKMTGTVPGLLVTMEDVVDQLEKKRHVTARMRRTLKELLSLGNQAVNGNFVPSVESAKAYISAVQSTVDLMKERTKRVSSLTSS